MHYLHIQFHNTYTCTSTDTSQATLPLDTSAAHRNGTMFLLLPGKMLHLNVLLAIRKFRDRGNKAGAVSDFEALQEKGLGNFKPQRGSSTVRQKCD